MDGHHEGVSPETQVNGTGGSFWVWVRNPISHSTMRQVSHSGVTSRKKYKTWGN